MRVIYKAPGKEPEERDIPNTLAALQEAVGGYIETVTVCSDMVVICDEEGRLKGKEQNCTVCGADFVGPILFVGVDGENFTDCPLTMEAFTMFSVVAVRDAEVTE